MSTSKDRSSCFIDDARNRFLNAIRKHDRARDALTDLAGAPFEAFLTASPLDPSRTWQLVSITNSNLLPDLMRLRDGISAWMKRWNLCSPSLTSSRQSFHRFWQDTWAQCRRGQLHCINVNRLAGNLVQESFMFVTFIYVYFRQLLPHLFSHVAESRR